MSLPQDLRYAASHEWVRVEGDIATIGITDHAQEQLGDVVYVDLPDVGERVDRGDEAGEIESVKAVSSIYAPVSGTVVEINEVLDEDPETVNGAPYGKGWLFRVQLNDSDELDELLDPAAYAASLDA